MLGGLGDGWLGVRKWETVALLVLIMLLFFTIASSRLD